MAFDDVYRDQVALLIRAIPYVAAEDCFALKGGTAINLFYREMPRLSVDIDLTYLPLADREESLTDIERSLKRVSEQIGESDPSAQITESAPKSQDTIDKLFVRSQGVQIKIEVNPILRGCVNEPELMEICAKAEDQFGYNMSDDHRRFLASFYRRKPEWDLLGIDGVDRLPAVRWREINLDRAGGKDPGRHSATHRRSAWMSVSVGCVKL